MEAQISKALETSKNEECVETISVIEESYISSSDNKIVSKPSQIEHSSQVCDDSPAVSMEESQNNAQDETINESFSPPITLETSENNEVVETTLIIEESYISSSEKSAF